MPSCNEFALSGYALARFSEFWQGSLTASMPIGRSAFRLGLEGQYTANSATNGVWLAGLNGRLPIVLDNGRVTMGGKFLYGGDNRFLVETGIAYQLESGKLFPGK